MFLTDKFFTTTAWKKYDAQLIPVQFPSCKDHPLRTREYFECLVVQLTMTIFHPSCTAKMGNIASDPMAVVDSKTMRYVTIV
jgi:choline dehydrogenase